jgi:hypothetical protein
MDTNKETYQTPSVLIFEVKIEGVICGSGGTESYNRNTEEDW